VDSETYFKLAEFPYLRVLAGAIFVLAGLFAYYGVTFGASLALVLVIAGAVVIVVALAGHRAYALDIAVFVVALIILGGVASGYGVSSTRGPSAIQYTSLRTQATSNITQIDLLAITNSSSINVQFSANSSLMYQVRLVRGSTSGFPPFFFLPSADTYKLTNQTRGGILLLNVSASFRSIFVTLPSGYLTNINATTGAGTINIATSHVESLGFVSLSTGAGSIDANISSNRIRGIDLSTGAGSASLSSSYLGPNGSKVPISISTGAGTASLNAKIPSNASVSLDASTGLGSISRSLSSGFVISQSSNFHFAASEGNVNSSSDSFEITISTGAGTINIKAQTI
jgi:hypothetical protein